MNNKQLEIEVNSIRNGNSLFPVKLEAYKMDGLPGIHILGAITKPMVGKTDLGKTQAKW